MHAVLIVDDDHAFPNNPSYSFEEGSGSTIVWRLQNAFEALNRPTVNAGLSRRGLLNTRHEGLQLAHQLKAREPALPISC